MGLEGFFFSVLPEGFPSFGEIALIAYNTFLDKFSRWRSNSDVTDFHQSTCLASFNTLGFQITVMPQSIFILGQCRRFGLSFMRLFFGSVIGIVLI